METENTEEQSTGTKETDGSKKSPKKIIFRVLIIFILANIVLALPIASFAEVLVLRGKGDRKRSLEPNMDAWLYEETGIDADAFEEKYRMTKVSLPSNHSEGYRIPVFHYLPETESRGFVVMAHGMNSSHIGIYPEAEVFLEEGFEVYSFDERKFGESDWPYITYGYYEGWDVEDVFDYAMQNSPEDCLKGIWGQSLGGAACENAMDENLLVDNLDFAVLDCPMGAMEDLTGAPKIQNRLASVINRLMVGYSFDDQNPYPQVQKNKADVLMIVAGKDSVIPASTTDKIQTALHLAPSLLNVYQSPDSTHADVVYLDPEGYRDAVEDIIEDAQE